MHVIISSLTHATCALPGKMLGSLTTNDPYTVNARWSLQTRSMHGRHLTQLHVCVKGFAELARSQELHVKTVL